ncbi:hypothetical protein Tco_1198355 [Tanacetum coccineum]
MVKPFQPIPYRKRNNLDSCLYTTTTVGTQLGVVKLLVEVPYDTASNEEFEFANSFPRSLTFLYVICFVIHSRQPPCRRESIRLLETTPIPSHEGYRNTIELLMGNNVVPLRSDTIRLVQNGCSFHGLRSKDPNQHLKDFLKLVDSLDLDSENRERTRLLLFQFSLRDQASNWLERLPAGSNHPHGGSYYYALSLLNSFHWEGPQNSAMIS